MAQELRPGDAPASARGVAVQLPQALARREQQAHATRRHLRSLRHDVLLHRGGASGTAEVTLPRTRRQVLGFVRRRNDFRYNLRSVARVLSCTRPRQPSPHNTGRKDIMTIKVGARLPAGTLSEYIEVATEACPIGPNQFQIDALTKGKKVVLFGLPGAFTPTCSAKHVPGYVGHLSHL